MNNPQDAVVLKQFTDILDSLNIVYVIGGSMASSVYGAVRFTQDADITVEPFKPVAEKLFDVLGKDFYISREAMYEALHSRSSFNVIHFATAFKIDVFIRPESEFHKQMLLRGRKIRLGDIAKPVSFVSPEDIILLKLDWYRQSGCVSERQWSDVKGVLGAQADSLDYDYLRKWSEKLGVEELFRRAMNEKKT
jgi:hypothetical protein